MNIDLIFEPCVEGQKNKKGVMCGLCGKRLKNQDGVNQHKIAKHMELIEKLLTYPTGSIY